MVFFQNLVNEASAVTISYQINFISPNSPDAGMETFTTFTIWPVTCFQYTKVNFKCRGVYRVGKIKLLDITPTPWPYRNN